MEDHFAYERLAADLSEQVRTGVLRPGDRITSVRQMSRRRGVSVSTVLQAYRLLEARRVIGARPKSGFFVLPPERSRIDEPGRTRPNALPIPVTTGELIADVLAAAGDPDLVSLGAALPDASLLPARALNRLMGTVLRRDPARATSFMGSAGCIELRREIARREWEAGCQADADEILVTCGAIEALSLALRATTRPGDTVAVESPAFFGLLQVIETLGCRALEIPTEARRGLCVDSLERALNSHAIAACVVTPNFHNPLGALMPDSAKRALVRLAVEREVPVIEDDTFGELYFQGPRPCSLLAEETHGWVIRCSTFSKILAPGYRLGWIVPGERFHTTVERLKLSSTIAAATPPQLAVAAYLGTPSFDRHLRRLRRTFRANVERLAFEVMERFPPGTRVSRPAGGFLLWVQLPGGIDAVALHQAARRIGVGVSPGCIYSASGDYRDCLRLSAGAPWSQRMEAGLAALAACIREIGSFSEEGPTSMTIRGREMAAE